MCNLRIATVRDSGKLPCRQPNLQIFLPPSEARTPSLVQQYGRNSLQLSVTRIAGVLLASLREMVRWKHLGRIRQVSGTELECTKI